MVNLISVHLLFKFLSTALYFQNFMKYQVETHLVVEIDHFDCFYGRSEAIKAKLNESISNHAIRKNSVQGACK